MPSFASSMPLPAASAADDTGVAGGGPDAVVGGLGPVATESRGVVDADDVADSGAADCAAADGVGTVENVPEPTPEGVPGARGGMLLPVDVAAPAPCTAAATAPTGDDVTPLLGVDGVAAPAEVVDFTAVVDVDDVTDAADDTGVDEATPADAATAAGDVRAATAVVGVAAAAGVVVAVEGDTVDTVDAEAGAGAATALDVTAATRDTLAVEATGVGAAVDTVGACDIRAPEPSDAAAATAAPGAASDVSTGTDMDLAMGVADDDSLASAALAAPPEVAMPPTLIVRGTTAATDDVITDAAPAVLPVTGSGALVAVETVETLAVAGDVTAAVDGVDTVADDSGGVDDGMGADAPTDRGDSTGDARPDLALSTAAASPAPAHATMMSSARRKQQRHTNTHISCTYTHEHTNTHEHTQHTHHSQAHT
jgi:hypothetical protein